MSVTKRLQEYKTRHYKIKPSGEAKMALLNNCPFPNSDSKCLMENWFEERTSKQHDEGKSTKEKNQRGHDKILTLNTEAKAQQCSEYKINFRNSPGLNSFAPRNRLLETFLIQKATKELQQDLEPPFHKCDFKTEYSGEICREDFYSVKPTPKFKHSLYSELPVSYWTENAKTAAIHGVTQIKTSDSPFRKNAAFSKVALDEAWDDNQAKPGETDVYPKF